MKKYSTLKIISFLILGFISFPPNSVFADKTDKNVNITFVYEKIEDIIEIGKLSGKEIWQIKEDIEDEGCDYVYSRSNPDYLYKIRKTKVSSEQELIEAMGCKSELFLKYGQKCLLTAFREANSEKFQLKAEGLDNKETLEIQLMDTSNDGKIFGKGYNTTSLRGPRIADDFWPCSHVNEPVIELSDVTCKYKRFWIFQEGNGKKEIRSTINHEYAHFLDDTEIDPEKYDLSTVYGLDGSHYLNEVTNEGMAFIEGWAEYNEMLENKRVARMYNRSTKTLKIESETEAGKYSKIKSKDSDFSTFLKSEAYNAKLLYQLSQKIGKEKINETFVRTSDNKYRDLQYFVKKLVEFYPEDAQTICEVVDEVFLDKASNEELLEMVGKTKATEAYVEKRTSNDKKVKESNSEKTGKIRDLGQRLVKALNPDKNKMVEKPTSPLGQFFSDVKDILVKGVETVRDFIDTIFDKIRSFFKKDKTEEENYEIEETDDTVKKEIINTSDKENIGPSDNPFSIVK